MQDLHPSLIDISNIFLDIELMLVIEVVVFVVCLILRLL